MYSHLYITAQKVICLFTLTRCTTTYTLQLKQFAFTVTRCTTTYTLQLKQFAFLPWQDVPLPIHYSSICLFTVTRCTTTYTLQLKKQFAFLPWQDVLPPIHYRSSNLPFYCSKMYYHPYITAQAICLFTVARCTTTYILQLKQFAFLL